MKLTPEELSKVEGWKLSSDIGVKVIWVADGNDYTKQGATPLVAKLPNNSNAAETAANSESAWLVEKTVNGFPHYLYASCLGLFEWTPVNSKAMRFSRREDADMICNVVEDAEKVAQHVWTDAEDPKAAG
jgi:hypothetical protein